MLILIAIFLVISLLIALFAGVVITCIAYKEFQEDIAFSLSFKQFQKFYVIAPEKYELDDGIIRYGNFPYTFIGMKTPLDFIRYRLWFVGYKRAERERKSDQRLQKYINSVRKDLERFEKDCDNQ